MHFAGSLDDVHTRLFPKVRKYDVEPQVLYDVMTEGLFSAPAYKVYGKIIVDESYAKAGSTILVSHRCAFTRSVFARIRPPPISTTRQS